MRVSSILNENICGNNKIIHRNTPLWFVNFNKSGLKQIKDIWNTTRKDFAAEEIIVNKLTDKRNGIKHYRIIQTSINNNWLNILKSNQVNTMTTESDKRKIAIRQTPEQINKLSMKQIQNILSESDFKPKYMAKWEDTLAISIDWKQLWQMSLETPLSNKEKQLHWKIIQNAIFTEYKLSLMGRSNGKCHLCKTDTEYLTHLFFECKVVKDIVLIFQNKINNTLQANGQDQIHFNEKNFILGFDHQVHSIRIYINTILHIVKWELWKIRNLIKYEKKVYSISAIVNSIMLKIKTCYKFLKYTNVTEKYHAVLALLEYLQ